MKKIYKVNVQGYLFIESDSPENAERIVKQRCWSMQSPSWFSIFRKTRLVTGRIDYDALVDATEEFIEKIQSVELRK